MNIRAVNDCGWTGLNRIAENSSQCPNAVLLWRLVDQHTVPFTQIRVLSSGRRCIQSKGNRVRDEGRTRVVAYENEHLEGKRGQSREISDVRAALISEAYAGGHEAIRDQQWYAQRGGSGGNRVDAEFGQLILDDRLGHGPTGRAPSREHTEIEIGPAVMEPPAGQQTEIEIGPAVMEQPVRQQTEIVIGSAVLEPPAGQQTEVEIGPAVMEQPARRSSGHHHFPAGADIQQVERDAGRAEREANRALEELRRSLEQDRERLERALSKRP